MGNGESTQPRAASGEEDLSHKETAKTASAVAGAMLLGWGLYKIVTGSDEKSERKKMKAPGKDSVIYRDDFEKDPAGYFRSLRK